MSKSKSPTEWLHDTLIRLIADTDDSMEFVGSVFNPKDSAQRKVSKSLERAEQAILNHVEELVNEVIGEDERPRLLDMAVVGDSEGYKKAINARNALKVEMRAHAKQLIRGKD